MNLFGVDIQSGLELAERVGDKYRPVFEKFDDKQRAALAWYFLPHRSKKPVVGPTRPRILKWYCPFADQRIFPTGHRYCINVYTGCSHNCEYCYAASYEPEVVNCKKNFERGLLRDLADLDTYDVRSAPVHLSNSTDPFQPLEQKVGQTKFTLQQLLRYRHRFTSIVLLTKNPSIAAKPGYLEILQALMKLPGGHPAKHKFDKSGSPALRVEVSLAFWRDEAREFFDSGAASVESRTKAIRTLRKAGIPVVLRIDPLLPPPESLEDKSYVDFDLPTPQTHNDIEELIKFAVEAKPMHIVYSAARIVQPRFKPMSEPMQKLKSVYEHLASPDKLVFRGGSFRLPENIIREQIFAPFLQLCKTHNIPAVFCHKNLISTP